MEEKKVEAVGAKRNREQASQDAMRDDIELLKELGLSYGEAVRTEWVRQD